MQPVVTSFGAENYAPTNYVTLKAASNRTIADISADTTLLLVGEADGGIPNQPYIFTGANISAEIAAVFRSGQLQDDAQRALIPGTDNNRRVTSIVAVNAKPGTPSYFFVPGTLTVVTLTAGAGSTLTSLVLPTVAGLAGPVPIGTILTFTGGKQVQVLQPIVNSASSQTISIRTLVGVAIVTTETSSYKESGFGLQLNKFRDRANQVTMDLQGSLVTGYTIVVKDIDLGLEYARQDKLGLAFTLAYTGGAGSTKTVSVVLVNGVPRLQTTITANAAENIDIPLVGLTIRALVTTLNNHGSYSATVSRSGDLSAALLDIVTAQDISNVLAPVQFTALKGDLALYFATGTRPQFFTFIPGATPLLTSPTFGYFAGGSTSATLSANWQDATYALAAFSGGAIAACTPDQSIHAAIQAVVNAMWDPSEAKCPLYFRPGDQADLPIDSSSTNVGAYINVISPKIAAINSSYVMYVASTRKITDASGVSRLATLAETAVDVAALRVAYGAGTPITYKALKGDGVFPVLDRPGSKVNREKAVRNGALVLEALNARGGAKVVFGRTTYVGENNDTYETESMMAKLSSYTRGIKPILDRIIPGQNATGSQLSELRGDLSRYSRSFQERGLLTSGVDASGQPVAAYDIQLQKTTQNGKLVRVVIPVAVTPETRTGEVNVINQLIDVVVA